MSTHFGRFPNGPRSRNIHSNHRQPITYRTHIHTQGVFNHVLLWRVCHIFFLIHTYTSIDTSAAQQHCVLVNRLVMMCNDSLPYHFYGVILTLEDKVANYYSMCYSTQSFTNDPSSCIWHRTNLKCSFSLSLSLFTFSRLVCVSSLRFALILHFPSFPRQLSLSLPFVLFLFSCFFQLHKKPKNTQKVYSFVLIVNFT